MECFILRLQLLVPLVGTRIVSDREAEWESLSPLKMLPVYLSEVTLRQQQI